jgi:ribosomal protein L37AE/L43A
MGFTADAERFEELDTAALRAARLNMRSCPNCGTALRPVAFTEDVWGCSECHETWHLPSDDHDQAATATG